MDGASDNNSYNEDRDKIPGWIAGESNGPRAKRAKRKKADEQVVEQSTCANM